MGVDERLAGGLPGRFVRTMSITIGGVPKAELYEKAKAVRMVSPYAKRLMKHEQFTTLPKSETILLIALTPEDLGFTERPMNDSQGGAKSMQHGPRSRISASRDHHMTFHNQPA